MNKYQVMCDRYLMEAYVPDVYQPSIYTIDYQKLKDADVKMISFDIDDTIADTEAYDPPKEAVTLFENLKKTGFELWLLTNANEERAKNYANKFGISGCYILKNNKPIIQTPFGGEGNCREAHVGKSNRDDVFGGNSYGIITCLVRPAGKTSALRKPNPKNPGRKTQDQMLLDALLERGIWRKHHLDVPNDQYYQLGEQPPYIQTQNIVGAAAAVTVATAYLIRIRKLEADKDKPFRLDEFMRSSFNNNLHNEMKTLCYDLGDDIVFTATWTDAQNERELEDSELSNGEMSGFVFTIGCYTIRHMVYLYRSDYEGSYSERVLADPDEIAKYKKNLRKQLYAANTGFWEKHIISAKHKDMSDWQEICSIGATSILLEESLDLICTVKYDASESDEREMLFVCKKSDEYKIHGVYWYRLKSDGTVTVNESIIFYE